MSDLVKSGVTKAMVEQHLSLLGAYNLAGLDAACTEIGVAWHVGNGEWDESLVGLKPCHGMAVVLRWEGGDDPYDDGDYFWSGDGVIDPTEAARDAVRQAFVFIAERWEDNDADEEDEEDEEEAQLV